MPAPRRAVPAFQPGFALAHGCAQAVYAIEHFGNVTARNLSQIAHFGGLELVVLDVQQLHDH
jgi:hypothetical protein